MGNIELIPCLIFLFPLPTILSVTQAMSSLTFTFVSVSPYPPGESEQVPMWHVVYILNHSRGKDET